MWTDGARPNDESIVIHGVSWEQYEAIRDRLDDIPGLRMTYLEGALEIMSPSLRHEQIKKTIARLLELYAVERNIDLTPGGSTTFRKRLAERGLEPDECYCLGSEFREPPDFALEVVLGRVGIDKLKVYEGLGVPEVWLWRDERLALFALGPGGYQPTPRSRCLPDLDVEVLASFVAQGNHVQAVRAFLDLLRAEGGGPTRR